MLRAAWAARGELLGRLRWRAFIGVSSQLLARARRACKHAGRQDTPAKCEDTDDLRARTIGDEASRGYSRRIGRSTRIVDRQIFAEDRHTRQKGGQKPERTMQAYPLGQEANDGRPRQHAGVSRRGEGGNG
jgi:hypothetical protein